MKLCESDFDEERAKQKKKKEKNFLYYINNYYLLWVYYHHESDAVVRLRHNIQHSYAQHPSISLYYKLVTHATDIYEKKMITKHAIDTGY